MSWPEDNGDGSFRSVNEDELFVFGYGCKIFRDDEKAAWVDEGKHLIPWMGDGELLIDRYDGRGALMDLKSYEPAQSGMEIGNGLTPEEAHIEKLCDVERYRDFNEDEEFIDRNEASYQEEEFRRLQMAVNEMSSGLSETNQAVTSGKEYGSVGYSYSDNVLQVGPEPKKLDDDVPYVQPPDLAIPAEILHPLTMKSHAIIEKTAKFIASQGTQMEIILKTKQAKNPQFDFLSHNDPLNPYYKFLVYAIKSNLYKPSDEIPYPDDSSSNESGSENGENSSDGEDGYLHPSLTKKSSDINKFIPRVNLKPSTNCAYSMLVSKIKEVSNDKSSSSPQTQQQQQQQQGLNTDFYSHANTNIYPVVPTPQPLHSTPDAQEQLIIEKMASYVVKNGPDFEMMAYQKKDPRFAFLDPLHEHNWYYLSCKERCTLEANAVVASKSFIRYQDNLDKNTLVQPSSSSRIVTTGASSTHYSSISSTSSINSLNTAGSSGDEVYMGSQQQSKSNSYASTVHKPRNIKEVTTKGKSEKEKVIKISSTLTNFTAVLKQKEEEEALTSINNESVKTNKVDDEEEVRRLKEERRRKAAIFLQSLKKTQQPSVPPTTLQPLEQTETSLVQTKPISISTETFSDVESIPSPTKPSPLNETPNNNFTILQPVSKPHNDLVSNTTNQSELNVKDPLQERLNSTGDIKVSDNKFDVDNNKRDKTKSDRRSSRSHNRRRSRSPRRSRSSSLSDSRSSSSSSSSSYSHKRKKSKKKHSKKNHKKRDRSKSKKSKKRRH